MEKKYFPIKTETACKSKWGWSSVYLSTGATASCCRASTSKLTVENFDNFHNTPQKISSRRMMLDGQWPGDGCEYCSEIETLGQISERQIQNSIPGLFPQNIETPYVDPAILEVYFSNTCNLSCVYCNPRLSSTIDAEYRKYGDFNKNGVSLIPLESKDIGELEPKFWNWMEKNFYKLERFHLAGGEPFYQKQLDLFIEFVDQHPNKNCEFNVITNLMINKETLIDKIEKIKRLVAQRKLSRFDITVSIDCWGVDQEYVRYGINLEQWVDNFNYLLEQKWIKININQTISVLTIKTMPELISKLNEWRQKHSIGHYFGKVSPGPSYLHPSILGKGVFDKDFERVLELMTSNNDEEKYAKAYMLSISKEIESTHPNFEEINKLKIFLDENDRRRGLNWRNVFPWLEKEIDRVV